MADRGDTHYRTSRLNVWFTLSSVFLLASIVWMVLADWNRPWKGYQRRFRELELAKLEREAEELERSGAVASEEELRAAVEEARSKVDARAAELKPAEEALIQARGERWKAVEDAKRAKAEFNYQRFLVEEHRRESGDLEYGAEGLAEIERRMNEAIALQQEAEAAADEAQARRDDLRADVDQAEKALAAGTRDLARVRSRLEALQPRDPAAKVAQAIRDAPGLGFVGPTLKVQKQVLDDLSIELNFTKGRRIDMCQTCHMGIDRAGFEEAEQPFTAHPRLDLYLTAKSPHPLKEVGCTICHRGDGLALDFVRADHRPSDPAEAERWAQEHHWDKQHHWDYPMLATPMVEASCVQCHKSSMELIADDAPTLSQGYRTFEQYGCYACHKVEWFPTKRRPGPTLKNFQAKFGLDFLQAWIANPKGFRPSTWMPQFFHLENYAPAEPVVASRYGAGREILGKEWDDASVSAISAFLASRAPRQALPPAPLEGDAHRGREVMRLSGCFACHNVAPWSGEAKTKDPALEKSDTNQMGPNLRGVATKLDRDWLYWWIKDPQGYWPETRMPDLRLSDQDAADITAYMLEDPDKIFHDVPQGWETSPVAMADEELREVLAEQARWFFSREGRAAIERRLEGQDPELRWDDLETLKVAVGEKLVANFGCFSCHEIEGLEDMMPIGTELTTWGSKTVDKLDFGFGEHLFGLDPHYREGWLVQKLRAPRSFDREKVKNPSEKLRMPWFGFGDDQVEALATFVVGLVDDEVQRARMEPSADELAMDSGLRAVRQKNCLACHMVDPGTVTYEDEHGVRRTVTAELLPLEDRPQPPRHDLAQVRRDLEELELDEVGFRLLRAEPEVGGVGERVFVPAEKLFDLGAPRGGDFVRVVTDYYYFGIELFDPEAANEDEAYSYVTADPEGGGAVEDVDGSLRNHSEEPYDKIRWTFAPPVLWDEGAKLQKQWFYGFLHDVVPLRPQVRVRMPSFHFDGGEAAAITDYFALKSAREWPARYARALHLSSGKPGGELAAEIGIEPGVLAGIENGNAADTQAAFAKVLRWGTESGFALQGPVDPDFDVVEVRMPSYLASRAAELPEHLEIGRRIATDAVNCYQCHFRLGEPPPADPIAWAPDLALTRERLRPGWVRTWLADPSRLYPGTSMPANFTGDPPQYQAIYPNSNNEEQIRVVLEYLFNFDRMGLGEGSKTASR
jgi:cytochrome c2